jgi:carboxypeptidase T
MGSVRKIRQGKTEKMPHCENVKTMAREALGIALITLVLTFLFLVSLHAQLEERYHTYEETVAELDSLFAVYPDIMRMDSIGVSTRDSMVIWTVKISDNVRLEEDEPAVLYSGVHHAEEVLGLEICLFMIRDVLNRYGADSHVTWWVNNIEIWFLPLLNPEGHKVVTDGLDVTFRKNKRDNNGNGTFDYIPEIGEDIDGVDLNRNYDFHWERGETDWASDYYRGPAPFSESENCAIRDLALDQRFVFAILYHSARTGTKEVVYYPWCWDDKYPPDFPIIQDTAEKVAALIQKDDGLANYSPWCSSLRAPFARDWFYARTGAIPILIEVGSTIQPPGDRVDDICARNMVGAYYLLDRVMGGGISGTVVDSVTGMPLDSEVAVLEACGGILSPRLCDPVYGRYRRILLPGSYTVEVSKAGYRTRSFSDIPVNPSASTPLNVALSPLPEWNFTGTVADVQSGTPVEATLRLHGSVWETAISDPSTGAFDVPLFEDSYRLEVTAEGYVAVVGSLSMICDTAVSFNLQPADTLFSDDFESGLSGWSFGGTFDTWGLTTSSCQSMSHSLTESPNGLYVNGNDTWAALAHGLDVSLCSQAALVFWHDHRFEPDFDSAWVEVSVDEGMHWKRLGKPFSGSSGGWVREVRRLTEWCGTSESIDIRFRLITDGSVDDDGWSIDDVLVLVGGQNVALENGHDRLLPQSFHLGQNYPNPFNPSTDIEYQIGESGSPIRTTLKIYNVLGQEVRTLVDEVKKANVYTVTWDGRDKSGCEVTSGIYLYRCKAGQTTQVRKMVLLR